MTLNQSLTVRPDKPEKALVETMNDLRSRPDIHQAEPTALRHLASDFARSLEVEIPGLRRYARALTRDVTRADDLVQSSLMRAVVKQHLWQPGTDLRAWLFTILHNQNVNDVRRSAREGTSVNFDDVASTLTTHSNVHAALELRDLERAMAKLATEQRQVILLVCLEGMSYEDVAQILAIPVGTVRSRLSRGRGQLRRLMGVESYGPVSEADHSNTGLFGWAG